MDDAIHPKVQRRLAGRQANRWGRKAARKVMEKIGAQRRPRGNNSNECMLSDERVVIKLAKAKTTSVKITYRMLRRIQAIIGAFEGTDGEFHLWKISSRVYEDNMWEDPKKRALSLRAGTVTRRIFEEKGESMGAVTLDLE